MTSRENASPTGRNRETLVPEITIPLQQVSGEERGNKEEYYNTILEEYSIRYLAALGVVPTAQNKVHSS